MSTVHPVSLQNQPWPGAGRGHFVNQFPQVGAFGSLGKAFYTVGKLVFPSLHKNISLIKFIFL
jgi:hypothetical protein